MSNVTNEQLNCISKWYEFSFHIEVKVGAMMLGGVFIEAIRILLQVLIIGSL